MHVAHRIVIDPVQAALQRIPTKNWLGRSLAVTGSVGDLAHPAPDRAAVLLLPHGGEQEVLEGLVHRVQHRLRQEPPFQLHRGGGPAVWCPLSQSAGGGGLF